MPDYEIVIPEYRDHPKQMAFIESDAKRIIVRAGRRSGKTYGLAIRSVQRFLKGRRQLYAAPTAEQLDTWWNLVCEMLDAPIRAGVFRKNENEHIIEANRGKLRMKGKTAWNADTMRGDYADDLLMEEYQLMNEDAWGVVGAPMLLTNNGDAVFVYTPPSLYSRSISKANDRQHASKLYRKYAAEQEKGNKRYAAFTFTSHDNPHITAEALAGIVEDMSSIAYRMEIMAEDIDEAPGALWTRKNLESCRVAKAPDLERIAVSIDPSVSRGGGDEAGIVAVGNAAKEFYVLEDASLKGSPHAWAQAAVGLYKRLNANYIVAEANNGGVMVEMVIHEADPDVPVRIVYASRGKLVRAEPVATVYEQGRAHHVGAFPLLEDQLCLHTPGGPSPNRLDAMVWAYASLMNQYGSAKELVDFV